MANVFEAEVRRSAELLGLTYEKMAVPTKLGRRRNRKTGETVPCLVPLKENRYDSFIVYRGQHIALELKSSKHFESFPVDRVEPHQIAGLDRALKDECDAWLLLNFRREMVGGKSKSNNRAWFLPWSYWHPLMYNLREQERKSFPTDWFLQNYFFTPIPRVHVPNEEGKPELVWDLRVLLKGLS